VQPFLNLVKEMYANIKDVVENEFGKPGTGDVSGKTTAGGDGKLINTCRRIPCRV